MYVRPSRRLRMLIHMFAVLDRFLCIYLIIRVLYCGLGDEYVCRLTGVSELGFSTHWKSHNLIHCRPPLAQGLDRQS